MATRTTVTWNGDLAKAGARRGAARGLTLAAERLRGHSVERAPIDLGDLRQSASVIPADPSDSEPSATLVFDEPYAARQHEDETLNHTPGAAGEPAGEARYVAKNFEDETRRREYEAIIGREVQRALDTA